MQAGILPGDVITKMDDRVVGNFSSYSTALMQMEPGQILVHDIVVPGTHRQIIRRIILPFPTHPDSLYIHYKRGKAL